MNIFKLNPNKFIRNTYLALAGAIGSFALLETAMFKFGISQEIARYIFSIHDQFQTLGIIGAFLAIGFIQIMIQNIIATQNIKLADTFGYIMTIIKNSIIFAPILTIASNINGSSMIAESALLTGAITTSLTLIAFTTDIGHLGMFALGAGIIITSILSFFYALAALLFGFQIGTGALFLFALISMATILFNTYAINKKYYADNRYFMAAANLFDSIMDLFYWILRIMIRDYLKKD